MRRGLSRSAAPIALGSAALLAASSLAGGCGARAPAPAVAPALPSAPPPRLCAAGPPLPELLPGPAPELGQLADLAFSPDGSKLAASSRQGVWVFESATGQIVAFWPLQASSRATWSQAGQRLSVSLENDQGGVLLDPLRNEVLARWSKEDRADTRMLADGSTLARLTLDGQLELRSLTPRADPIKVRTGLAEPSFLDGWVSPGSAAALGQNRIRIWDRTGALRVDLPVATTSREREAVLSPDGRSAVLTDGARLVFVDVGSFRTHARELPPTRWTLFKQRMVPPVQGVLYSPSGDMVLAVVANPRRSQTQQDIEFSVQVYAPSGALRKTLPMRGNYRNLPSSMVLVNGGRGLCFVADDERCQVLDLESLSWKDEQPTLAAGLPALTSPDGALRARTLKESPWIEVLDASGARRWAGTAARADLSTSLPSPDGRRLALRPQASKDPVVLPPLALEASERAAGRYGRSLAWSDDGRWLVSWEAGQAGSLWDTSRGGRPMLLQGPDGALSDVGFLDAGALVTTSVEGSLTEWTLGDPPRPRRAVPAKGGSMAISSSGRFVAAVQNQQQRVEVWDRESGKVSAHTIPDVLTYISLADDGTTLEYTPTWARLKVLPPGAKEGRTIDLDPSMHSRIVERTGKRRPWDGSENEPVALDGEAGLLAAASPQRWPRWFDARTGREGAPLRPTEADAAGPPWQLDLRPEALSIEPRGALLVGIGRRGPNAQSARLWHLPSGEPLGDYPMLPDDVRTRPSQQGELLAHEGALRVLLQRPADCGRLLVYAVQKGAALGWVAYDLQGGLEADEVGAQALPSAARASASKGLVERFFGGQR